jgi:hypothetical protein
MNQTTDWHLCGTDKLSFIRVTRDGFFSGNRIYWTFTERNYK